MFITKDGSTKKASKNYNGAMNLESNRGIFPQSIWFILKLFWGYVGR